MNQLKRIEPSFSLAPRNLEEAIQYAKIIADSDLVPNDYKGKPANVLIAVQMGAEIGLKPLQAIQNIAIINGRPSVWGDALMAVARSSPECENIVEAFDDATMTATCTTTRKGHPPQSKSFSKTDAETARLWGKSGPWTNSPKRMLQMRARAFLLRDVYADALKGISSAEEVTDIVDMQNDSAICHEPVIVTVMPPYPDSKFNENFPTWEMLTAKGADPEGIIKKISTRWTLSEIQRQEIDGLKNEEELKNEGD